MHFHLPIMNGAEDERVNMAIEALAQLMFPSSETPLDFGDMDLDETYSLATSLRGPVFEFSNLPMNGLSNVNESTIGAIDNGVTFTPMDRNLPWGLSNEMENNIPVLDADESPAFTVDLNMFFDTHSSVFPDSEAVPPEITPEVGSLFTNDDATDQHFGKDSSNFAEYGINGVLPDSMGQTKKNPNQTNSDQRVPSLVNINRNRAISLSERMENTYLQPHPDRYYGKLNQNALHLFSESHRGLAHLLPSDFPQNNHKSLSPEGLNRQNTHLDTPDHTVSSFLRQQTDKRDNTSYRTSLMGFTNELLPLTTNTSLTPSVTSLHLNQPSFVSAQQYMRPLLEQLPTTPSRGSLDMYNRFALNSDGLSSGPPPVQTQRTFASYFSFRDKDRKQTEISTGEIEENMGQLQSRTLMRTIFKSGNQVQQPSTFSTTDDLTGHNNVFNENMSLAMQEDEPQLSSPKTPKRVRKGILNRFKPSKGSENAPDDQGDPNSDQGEGENDNLELSHAKSNQSAWSNTGMSQRSSALNSGNTSFGGSVQALISAGLDHSKSLEPNYGALFKGVAKRRTLVGMKGNKKTQVQLKKKIKVEESILENLNPTGIDHADSLENIKQQDQSLSSQTSQKSSVSYKLKIDNTEQTSSGSLATASKRILGSRILKRKDQQSLKQDPQKSNVLEVDLQKLDLPADTAILQDYTQPRGRREDKEADLIDETKIYICGYCSRRFKRQEHLKRHFRSLHTAEKPYDCPICHKKFSRTDNLNQHLKVHKGEDETDMNIEVKTEDDNAVEIKEECS